MAQTAYCSECGTRVQLTETGQCVFGHPRSALRDVRDAGAEQPAPRTTPGSTDAGRPRLTKSEERISGAIGKLIIIVPATIVIAFGLWSGYAVGVGLGQSKSAAWLSSIGSMLVTGVCVALLIWDRRRKMRR